MARDEMYMAQLQEVSIERSYCSDSIDLPGLEAPSYLGQPWL